MNHIHTSTTPTKKGTNMSNVQELVAAVEVQSQEVTQTEVSPEEAIKPLYNPFASPDSKSDVILQVAGHKLHVSKVVLSLASPVFEKMFDGDFKEKTLAEIPLPDKALDNMVEFLLCIYPSTSKPISRENFDVVLHLADEYQVQCLKDRCEVFVLATFEKKDEKYSKPCNQELVHFLYLADKYGLEQLLTCCIKMVKHRNYAVGENNLKTFSDFTMTSLETKCQIFSKRMEIMETSALECMNGANISTVKSTVRSKCFPLGI